MNASSDPCPWQANLGAFALGTLSGGEHDRLAIHLQDGCPACQAELEEVRTTLARMDELRLDETPLTEPPSDLWSMLEKRLDAEPRVLAGEREAHAAPRREWQAWSEAPAPSELSIVRGEDDYQATDFEGVEVRCLSVDAERESVTMQIRMAPGSSYPPHRHHSREECFVLSGDLHVGTDVMHQGDYQVAPAGSIHPVQSTIGGCELLIVSSQRDELLE